jgi:serine protease AprX
MHSWNGIVRRSSVISLFLMLLGAAPVGGAPASGPRLVAPLGNGDAAIARTLRLPAATSANDANGNKVFDTLEARYAARPGATQLVVVTLTYGSSLDPTLAEARNVAGPFAVTDEFHHLGGFAAYLRFDQALRIGTLPAVRQLEWGADQGRPLMDSAAVNGGVRAIQTSLDTDGDGRPNPITGKGVTMAILDSGFDGQHVDLKGKFRVFIDEHNGSVQRQPYDSDTHGTHVASIAAGLGVGDPSVKGVAPGADLVGFRIDETCPPEYFPYLEDVQGPCGGRTNVLNAVDWMLAHRVQHGIRIMSMSYGWTITSSVDGTDSLELAMDRLWEAGIIPFCAAGNYGADRGSIVIPSGARGAISVGAMSDAQVAPTYGGPVAPHLADFSSRGPTADGRIKPDVLAYGVAIRAAEAGTGDGYVQYNGTSMATPYAAGVAALLLEANPALTPSEVRSILLETAEDWGPTGADIDYGHGLIQPMTAIRRALGLGGAGPSAPASVEHIRNQLTVDGPSANPAQLAIDVADASGPLAVTVVIRGRSTPPVPDTVTLHPTDKRAIDVALLAPGETRELVRADYQSPRQLTFLIREPVVGRYLLRAHNLGRPDVLDVDVTGEDISFTSL